MLSLFIYLYGRLTRTGNSAESVPENFNWFSKPIAQAWKKTDTDSTVHTQSMYIYPYSEIWTNLLSSKDYRLCQWSAKGEIAALVQHYFQPSSLFEQAACSYLPVTPCCRLVFTLNGFVVIPAQTSWTFFLLALSFPCFDWWYCKLTICYLIVLVDSTISID